MNIYPQRRIGKAELQSKSKLVLLLVAIVFDLVGLAILTTLSGSVRTVESAPLDLGSTSPRQVQRGTPLKLARITAEGGAQTRLSQWAAPDPFPLAPSLLTFTPTYTYYFPFVGAASDLSISSVKVMQGTTQDHYAFTIQDRPAIVRAFVTVNNNQTLSGIVGRLYVVDGSGNSVGSVDAPAMTAPSVESDLASTLDFSAPGNWLKLGAAYYMVVNPNGALSEPTTGSYRYPISGTISFNVVYARPLQVVIVPILYLPYGASSSTLPQTSSISYLQGMPIRLLPVPNVTYTVRQTIEYAPTNPFYNLDNPDAAGWQALLDMVSHLHASEDPSGAKVYYGLVNVADAHAGCAGCTTGLGWVGRTTNPILATSVGWSGSPNGSSGASMVLTHEMGHNFGREHVRCTRTEGTPDESYPYAGGLIGVWGIDIISPALYDPAVYADFMSYCSNRWTSDYTFAAIKSFRENSPLPFVPVQAVNAFQQAMYVSGIIDASGNVTFSPVYEQVAPISNLAEGSHVLEVLDRDSRVLASFPFEPARIGDSNGATGFGFFIPAIEGRAGMRVKRGNDVIGEKIVEADPATAEFVSRVPTFRTNANTIEWAPVTHPNEPVNYRVRISYDGGATWEVLGLYIRTTQITVPAGVELTNALVEIQASDGIHVSTQIRDLRRTP